MTPRLELGIIRCRLEQIAADLEAETDPDKVGALAARQAELTARARELAKKVKAIMNPRIELGLVQERLSKIWDHLELMEAAAVRPKRQIEDLTALQTHLEKRERSLLAMVDKLDRRAAREAARAAAAGETIIDPITRGG
jgi:hypothetical protein